MNNKIVCLEWSNMFANSLLHRPRRGWNRQLIVLPMAQSAFRRLKRMFLAAAVTNHLLSRMHATAAFWVSCGYGKGGELTLWMNGIPVVSLDQAQNHSTLQCKAKGSYIWHNFWHSEWHDPSYELVWAVMASDSNRSGCINQAQRLRPKGWADAREPSLQLRSKTSTVLNQPGAHALDSATSKNWLITY